MLLLFVLNIEDKHIINGKKIDEKIIKKLGNLKVSKGA